MSSHRTFTPEFKAKIVIEVLQGLNTVSEIGAREKISPKQLGNWKGEFIENAHRAFSTTRDQKAARKAEQEATERERALKETIGQLVYERDWLKKKSEQSGVGRKSRDAR